MFDISVLTCSYVPTVQLFTVSKTAIIRD